MQLHLYEAAVGAAAIIAVPAAIIGMTGASSLGVPPAAQVTIEIADTVIDYPLPGEFLMGGSPAAAPIKTSSARAFHIMKQQVSISDYARCVADGACDPVGAAQSHVDLPVTGVNYLDAVAYARWYSKTTDEAWRLPTALEAAAAAAERFSGEPFSAAADDPANPAVRWLRRYREEAAAERPADPQPKPRGHYGPNSLGIEDFGGNVWEWTSTCYARTALGVDGTVNNVTENCGVRVLEGLHRAYMSNFVRNGKSGGCAVGTPPENLGFRLVRDSTSILAKAGLWIQRGFRTATRGDA